MSIHKQDIVIVFGSHFKLSMIIYPTFSLLSLVMVKFGNMPVAEIFKSLSIAGFVFFAYNLSVWFLKNTKATPGKLLPQASFFIYVSHIFVCLRMTKVMFMTLRPDNGVETIFAYVMSIVFTTLSLLLVFYLMKRFTPNFLGVVAGRR